MKFTNEGFNDFPENVSEAIDSMDFTDGNYGEKTEQTPAVPHCDCVEGAVALGYALKNSRRYGVLGLRRVAVKDDGSCHYCGYHAVLKLEGIVKSNRGQKYTSKRPKRPVKPALVAMWKASDKEDTPKPGGKPLTVSTAPVALIKGDMN